MLTHVFTFRVVNINISSTLTDRHRKWVFSKEKVFASKKKTYATLIP